MIPMAQPATRRLAIEALERTAREADRVRVKDISGMRLQPPEAKAAAAEARRTARAIADIGK